MCYVVLYQGQERPSEIKLLHPSVVKEKKVKFLDINAKNTCAKILEHGPKKVIFDGTCHKKSKHVWNSLSTSETLELIYVSEKSSSREPFNVKDAKVVSTMEKALLN